MMMGSNQGATDYVESAIHGNTLFDKGGVNIPRNG